MEETTEFSTGDVKQVNLRLRGRGHQKRIVMTFNPILNTHWLKTEFFDRPRENVRITKTTYKDNAFLDAEYKAELESLQHTDPYWYQVYTLGEWGQLGNVVFTNFVIEDFDYRPEDLENFGGGIDFGFNHPSAVVLAGMRDGEIYIYDEVYQKGLTNAELIEVAGSIDPDQQYAYIADSAEPDRIREWIQKGWDVRPAKKGKDSVRYGIDWMKGRKIHVHATRCPNTANEIQAYHYKEDREGRILDDPVNLNDDAIAATRYHFEDLWTGNIVEGVKWVIA
jgi:phage terminase large subunit